MINNTQPIFLYLDDDERSREVLQIMLDRMMGFKQVTLFEDSQDFEARLEALPAIPDVIFLDIQMKPLNGYQVLDILRSKPAYKDCIIIAMTATVMPDDVSRFQDVGFDSLIGKPLVHTVFPELLQKIMAGEKIWYIP